MTQVIAILDINKGNPCDDCGASLRYEYHTSDGGRYGSECIHRHIHNGDNLIFNPKKDIKEFQLKQIRIDKLYNWFQSHNTYPHQILFYQFKDGSGYFHKYSGNIDKQIANSVLEMLLNNGFEKKYQSDGGHFKIFSIEKI